MKILQVRRRSRRSWKGGKKGREVKILQVSWLDGHGGELPRFNGWSSILEPAQNNNTWQEELEPRSVSYNLAAQLVQGDVPFSLLPLPGFGDAPSVCGAWSPVSRLDLTLNTSGRRSF